MSIKLGGFLFTGPLPIDPTEVRANHAPVIFAVVAKGGPSWAPQFRVIDIGTSPDQGLRFAEHPRRDKWVVTAHQSVAVYLFSTPRSEYSVADRERIAAELRNKYEMLNGIIGN